MRIPYFSLVISLCWGGYTYVTVFNLPARGQPHSVSSSGRHALYILETWSKLSRETWIKKIVSIWTWSYIQPLTWKTRTSWRSLPNKTSGQILVRIRPDVGSVGRPILHPNRSYDLRSKIGSYLDDRIGSDSGVEFGRPNWRRYGRPNRRRFGRT